MEIVQVIFYSTFVSLSRDATPNIAKSGGRGIWMECISTIHQAIHTMIKREVKRESPSSSPSLCDDLVALLSLCAFSTCITNSGSSAGWESARCRNTSEYKAGERRKRESGERDVGGGGQQTQEREAKVEKESEKEIRERKRKMSWAASD